MIKIHLFVFCLLANLAYSQTPNNAKAPNSYIYDLDVANSNDYSGIEIPVVKAYEMWSNYEYLKSNGASNPIPAGIQSASIYWEDVPGMITSVAMVPDSDPSKSKIKVRINKGKGKGNAVVAFKVDGIIFWSWHIWVTDNPANGVTYSQGIETDINGNLINAQYMDRNLGATSNTFLGDQWQKSGGLMYEWGRKDPFPPLVYKDADFYQISGEVGILRHKQIDPVNTIPVELRPFDEIEKNMQYAINNPITYIINTDPNGNWFSSSRYKVAGVSPNYITWDLWSDNAKGGNSNGSSSNTTLRKESLSYELKSELDPCPNGWRVPSYYGRETQNNNLAFFGRKNSGVNDDNTTGYRQLFPDSVNPMLDGIKVYPGLGMDFTNAKGGARNLGIIPVSGGYVYYPNPAAPTAPVGVTFQDNAANGGLWSSTFAYDGARIFSMISDPVRNNTSVGLHAIYNNQTNPTKSGNAVKCMRDPNLAQIGDFATQYFKVNEEDFRAGLDNPNSYVIVDETHVTIPVNKAFSVYNQLLSDHGMIGSNNLVAKVLWSTNPNLVANLQMNKHPKDGKLSFIEVDINPGQKGNAVISLHANTQDSPPLWSWHIWATDSDPAENAVAYTTETPLPAAFNFINPTASKMPALKTVFMDRNLGAEKSDIASGYANGLHYQWGRKDPIPSFVSNHSQLLYVFSDNIQIATPSEYLKGFLINYEDINGKQYGSKYTDSYGQYGSTNPIAYKRIQENILYSVRNPLRFLYQSSAGAIYDGGNHYNNDLSKVNDWVSNERGQAEDRWGHGDKKSPFDPCPEGWRVPDVSFTNLYTGSKGTSPWYNGYNNDAYGKAGVIQDQWHDLTNFYGGTVEGNNGWKFESPTFNIGNFPKDGIRGELSGKTVELARSGVWTASLADMHTGFALGLQFQGNKMQTATGVYPQAGMSVRCAKDESRLLGTTAPKNTAPAVLQKNSKQIVPLPANNELKIYPNPFKDEFSINNTNSKNYEIYDFSGKLVLKGTVQNGRVNATTVQKGIYILKIFMNDGSVVSKKLIKQ